MQRHIDGSSKFAGIDPEQVDLSLGGSDEDVVLARVEVEARDLAVVDEELREGRHIYPVVLDLNQLKAHAVGCSDRKDAELGFVS